MNIILASTRKGAIGHQGKLPWPKLSSDFKRFKELTDGNVVVMGYKTWESLPIKPLPGRLNIIISRDHEINETENIKVRGSYEEAITIALESGKIVYIIGGAQIYNLAFIDPRIQKVYWTQILTECEADTWVSEINTSLYKLESYSPIITENGIPYQFLEYSRQVVKRKIEIPYSHQEYQYLNLVENVLRYGNVKGDRTGTGVKSLFGAQMRYDLSKSFPLLTTKKVFWRGVAEELFWIISGSTDTTILSKKGIHIWDKDTCRETLDKRGFTHLKVGDLARGYGIQLRNFGARYINCDTDYKGQGIDQLMLVIDKIRNNPNDRRILFCLWNPMELDQSVLVPCHVLTQFYVTPGINSKRGSLSCHMYQRSLDCSLGYSFNLASYALLTCLIAQVCNLLPGEFIHSIGDYHIYNNTVDGITEQLTREPKPFPKLEINPEITDIEKFQFSDLKLIGYQSHEAIKMPLSV